MRQRLLFTIGVAALPLTCSAVSLEEAVRLGISLNPLVAQAEFEFEEAATGIDIAKDGYWPQVTMSAGPESLSASEFGYDITAQQALYDWGRVDQQVENASAQYRQRREALQLTVDEAALDVVETYLDVLNARQRLSVVENYIARLEDIADLTDARSNIGYSDQAETARTQLELSRALEQAAIEQGDVQDAILQFQELVNVAPNSLISPTPPALTNYLRNNPESMQEMVLMSPQFRQGEAQIASAFAETEEMRAALRPQLNLEGSLQRREIGGEMQNDSVVALRLSMDTFQGLSNVRRVESANQRLEAARWSAQATRRDILRGLTTLIETYQALAMREEALSVQVQSAASVVDTYEEQFAIGMRDVFDLLSLQRDLFEAQRQQVELATERKRTQYRVAAQLGVLSQIIGAESQNLEQLLGSAYAGASNGS